MANNRDSSKQKRARQNRAQREAREARAKAAALPAEERKAKYASSAPDAAPAKKGRGADRPRPERRIRPGDVPVDIETLEGNWYTKRLAVPGGRQVLTGAVLTIVITVLTVITKYPDPDATGEAKKKATESFFDIYGSAGIPLLLVPLVAVGAAAWFTLSPNRRRIWIGCSFVASISAVVLGIPYIFPVGFLVYAVMRANKIEGPVPGSRAARAVAERDAQADDAPQVDAEDRDDTDG